MRTLKTICFLLLMATLLNAQDQQVVYTGGVARIITLLPGSTITNGTGDPSGACVAGSTYTDSVNAAQWRCVGTTWTLRAVNNFVDYIEQAAPANPPSGTVRWYSNSTTHVMTCLRSDGSDCTPITAITGAITFVSTGTCPAGSTQMAAAGDYILLTVAANGDAGTTGGSTAYTPAGTNAAATFTGSSATTSATSGGTPAGTNGTATTGATSGGTPAGTVSALTTGADSSTTGGVAKAVAQTPTFTGSALATHTHTVPAEVFTGSALATHTHTLTATGTNSAAAFTGTGATIQPTFIKLIGCTKN